jgi:hypothetical protein
LSGPPRGERRKPCWLGTDRCARLKRGLRGGGMTDGPPDNSCW